MNRRHFLAGAGVAGALGTRRAHARPSGPSVKELDKVAAEPVLRVEGLKGPVVIDSIRLLKRKDGEYVVHVRSKDGAEGVSVTNPPRPEYLAPIFNKLVAPNFVGKDARDLENLLWENYRAHDN